MLADSATGGAHAAAEGAAGPRGSADKPAAPLRVLFLAPQPFFQERGTPIRARNILRALSEAGWQVDILCYPFGDPIELPGLRIFRSPRVPGIRDVRVGPSLAKVPLGALMALKAFWLCLRNRYDVIHAVEEAAFFGAGLKTVFRCKFVYNLDSFISEHLEYSGFLKAKPLLSVVRLIERMTIRRANIGVTVGGDISEKVRIISPRTTVLQLEDAPLNDCFEERAEEAAEIRRRLKLGAAPVVLYAGNFGGYQGIDLLIRAAASVRITRPDVRFVLVGGDSDSIKAMTGLAQRLGVDENCIFTGRRPTQELGAYLTLADLLVSPRTHGTNTPLKIYDYMQSGRPIVATNLLTHTQVLDETCAALTAPEPDAFAGGVLRLMNDKDLGARLANAAAKRIEDSYALPIFKRKVEAAYRQLWSIDAGSAHVPGGSTNVRRESA
jgi:glycosyltransferase involved in cell wall biosynthesis